MQLVTVQYSWRKQHTARMEVYALKISLFQGFVSGWGSTVGGTGVWYGSWGCERQKAKHSKLLLTVMATLRS